MRRPKMDDIFVEGITLPEAYNRALLALYGSERGEISLVMKVKKPLMEPRISKCFIGGPRELEQYRLEILLGILDFEVEAGLWQYTYHQRIAPYIQGVIDELKKDLYSRRAAISVRDNDMDEGTDNPACLQHIHFLYRDGALNMRVLFRSNDGPRASFMNAFALIGLLECVAYELDVPVGEYVHVANSYHVYPECKQLLASYVKRIESGEDLTYNYSNGWDKLMHKERDSIFDMVIDQRKKLL